MIFESLWPLTFLLAVPVVIILYLLKPRGKDYRISSNLLWAQLFRNQQSKTFLEKFVTNILMYLQILVILLLVLALMSPFFQKEGRSRGNVILVFDTSGSMQHDTGEGRTRLEEVIGEAKNLIAASEETSFSIVSNDCMGTNLLAVGVKDRESLYGVLEQLECCDGPGNLQEAESVVETLRGAAMESGDAEETAEVILYTDGNGAKEALNFSAYFDARVVVAGNAVSNVSNNFLSYVDGEMEQINAASNAGEDMAEERRILCASSLTNYSDVDASLEISLYEGSRLLQVKQQILGAGETTLCFFEEFSWGGEPLRSEIGSVKFAGRTEGDSLVNDNVAYAILEQESQMDAVLIGEGNTYLEKAYQAVTGLNLTKVAKEELLLSNVGEGEQDILESDSGLAAGGQEKDAWAIRIYDAGEECTQWELGNQLLFHDNKNVAGQVEKVLLTATGCDLTSGLSAFGVGVNETNVYEVPEWGTGFLWAGEQCAAYYGEHDGVKTVVVGFDIRESDFPLKPEFPIFISNALHFLGESSLLAGNVYGAGDRVLFHPQADYDVETLTAQTRKAGLYEVSAGEITEQYVVRFAAGTESDGQIQAQGTDSDISYGNQLIKKRLRNWVLALILLLLIVEWIVYLRQTRYRGRFYLGVRLIGMAMLFLALCGIAVNRRDGANTTIFLVDISNSNEQNLAAMEEYLEISLSKMPKDNQYGIVTFGKNSLVEQFITKENQYSKIMSLPDKTATNFEAAVSRALAMIPAEGAGRVVVLTDGKETKGNLVNTASALASRQIELLAALYEVSQGQDAYVENVELPSYLYQGDAYSMTVTVTSNYETDAGIEIWMGSVKTAEYDVHLNRGVNQYRFRQKVMGESIESFQVKVTAEGDTCRENDSYHVYSVVDSVPKVLLVSGMKEDSAEYENLLRAANCNYQRVSAINAPDTLDKMLEFKSIVLENVYLSDLPDGFLANVETYVKEYGCGLICCGGEESYALGGYRESVLETVLPVDMELRGVDEAPSMAMIMVIDHSGSMSTVAGSGATNLDLAITAAKTAVNQMRSTDYVGVITFDDRFSWVVEPTLAKDKEEINSQIETIADGGGTTIQPALWEALKGVNECDVSIRHVILLTDGQGESRNYSNIVDGYTGADVTLSTVAVGTGADARVLERLAEDCGGRYYYSDIVSDIPKIFAQEVFLSGDTYLQNGVFGLAVNSNSEITRGLFEKGWPNIYGYVSATPKNTANVLIASEKDDPVLTIMQYGLGHTVAWNTDVTNRWTAGFAKEEDYVQLWKRVIDYSAGTRAIGEDSVEVTTAGGYTNIVYHALDYGQQTRVEAVYTDPEGNTQTAPLQATAPGRFETRLDTDVAGIYLLSVRRVDDGAITNAITTAAVVQYSDEYKFNINNAAFKGFVERYGRLLEPEEEFWQQRKSDTKERYELTQWLIWMAALWFLMDIALRRLHFLPQDTKLYQGIQKYCADRKNHRYQKDGNRKKAVQSGESGTEEPNVEVPERDVSPTGEKKRKSNKLQKGKEKQEPQALDTSVLLRKKDQRKQ